MGGFGKDQKESSKEQADPSKVVQGFIPGFEAKKKIDHFGVRARCTRGIRSLFSADRGAMYSEKLVGWYELLVFGFFILPFSV